jgi:VanZ family protein
MKNMQKRRNRLLIVSFIVVLIVTMTPGDGKIAGNYIDKVVHFVVFLLLSINLCYKYLKSEKLTDFIIWAIFLGLMTEVIQQFIPGRNMDIYDGIADTLGVIVGFYIYKNKQNRFDRILKKLGA